MPRYYKIYFKFIFGASFLALLLAYSSEHFLDLVPCKMCYYQRYAYFAIIALCIVGNFIENRIKPWVARFVVLGLAVGIGLAFTHVGIEHGWFQLDLSCTGNFHGAVDTLEEFKAKIMAKDNVPCDLVTFTFLGVTMAGWNFAYSCTLFVLSSLMLFTFTKRKIKYES